MRDTARQGQERLPEERCGSCFIRLRAHSLVTSSPGCLGPFEAFRSRTNHCASVGDCVCAFERAAWTGVLTMRRGQGVNNGDGRGMHRQRKGGRMDIYQLHPVARNCRLRREVLHRGKL